MKDQLKNFDEFEYKEYQITTDLGSAYFDDEEEVVRIQGSCVGRNTVVDVEVIVVPEDSPEFNVSISASDGEITKTDLEFTAELDSVVVVGTQDEL